MKKITLKNKSVVLIIFILLLSLNATSCSNKDSNEVDKSKNSNDFEIVETTIEKETKEVVYYEDEKGFVVPINIQIPRVGGIAKEALRFMVVGSEPETRLAQSGIHGVLPEGTEIRGMSIRDGLCTVDLSKNILNTSSREQEENMVSALTYTLTEFPTINKVELLVEGQTLDELSNGYAINTAFERKNINLYGSSDGDNYTVYYKAPDTEAEGHYVPLTFSANSPINPAAAVEKLFSGPPADTDLSNDIPMGVNLRGVEVDEYTAVVNLGVEADNLTKQEFYDMNAIVALCLKQFDIEHIKYNIE